ncbi:MAG: hypothetical protein ACKPKO_49825, partial [Candidatus Fonsibacter sp.]
VVAIQKLMLIILDKTRVKRAELMGGLTTDTRGTRRLFRVQRPFFPDSTEGRLLRSSATLAAGVAPRAGAGWVAALPAYLGSVRWIERDDKDGPTGASWLELLADFEPTTAHSVRTAEQLRHDEARLLR